jgi:hypothetical protein
LTRCAPHAASKRQVLPIRWPRLLPRRSATQELDLAQLATRADLALLRGDLMALRSELMALRSDLEAKIAVAELRLIKWVIGVGVAAVLALTGVIWTATQLLLHAH